ncbi:Pyrimidine-specific ribonucleoside hydrolase RihB [Rubripirellula amarantea]|uniref:Pyrimidine-specific ribonucleoside hydrolase RihB n=1 Tax=Rubripirellula amarantea TaxID=2527999 RepID=A0A5C5WS67_9BACT|nr:nucleoside hydrolase [Rubripirellula amarantea]TWT53447.1 Pyrimidine-specific ribonucleoside hydrolase RihB [Rubripirellula amarantea]
MANHQRLTRRDSIRYLATASTALMTSSMVTHQADADEATTKAAPTHKDTFGLLEKGRKIPVIFDTDIGSDIDDTWALLYLLNCPEMDLRLVSTDAGQGPYRARLTARFLTECGHSNIPVSVGSGKPDQLGNQQDWVKGYNLESYAGNVYDDSVDAIIQTIHASPDPVTLICVGGVPNISEALRRDPSITNNARFVGMHGAIHVGYGGHGPPVPEANVRTDPKALRDVFAADWQCSITPLDTCGIVDLTDERYQTVYRSDSVGIKPLMENYRDWLTRVPWLDVKPDPAIRSSTLFDMVAVTMAFSEDLLEMETLPLVVDDKGMTLVDPDQGRPVRCAMRWKNLDAYLDHLVDRLVKNA